ncbi:homocysteine S-methyltransferase [Kribbella sp.]|uniref:homocysteine S-methyltransferase n=1 Tax=Kribbella sp. TaxID=1871183 RepID=UPI002D288E7B|nr:homocysteine S-methyltransferase [Kribbella sp.]HZX04155.1 homocysteine S-methyltransferase [Kribbella sp.]
MVILDGGLSNALEDRGHDLSDALWSARLLRDDPAEIAAVHRAYYEAGAMVATTASYQASVTGFERAGVPRAEAERLITSSVRIARDVRDEFDSHQGSGRRLVAASVGPYGAMLADGSEYRGRYGVSRQVLRDFHGARLELLAAAGPDLLAVETIPDTDEAEVLVALLAELDVPAWFSYSIDGPHTRAGQGLADAFAIPDIPQVIAIGINCCKPADVLPAVRTAVAVTGKPAVAYPNRGETWDALTRTWGGHGAGPAEFAPSWVDAGAAYVGGCCRVGPEDIRALAAGSA